MKTFITEWLIAIGFIVAIVLVSIPIMFLSVKYFLWLYEVIL